MIIVAAVLDDTSERIIRYLQDEHEIDINAAFFSVHKVAGHEMLVRAWLADPIETLACEPTASRDWEIRRQHGFISAGGAPKYYYPLRHLKVGDTLVAYQKKTGYLGVGTVRSESIPADEFRLTDGRQLAAITPVISGIADDHGERVVGVDWIKTFPISEGKTATSPGIAIASRKRQLLFAGDSTRTPPAVDYRSTAPGVAHVHQINCLRRAA